MRTPGDDETTWDRALGPLALAACVALLVEHAVVWWRDPPYNADSWTSYELARSLLQGDFYRVTGVRQYEVDGPYGLSFPPAHPLALALTEVALGVGWRAGFVFSHLAMAGLLAALASLSWRAVHDVLPGALTFALLLTFQPFMHHQVAGGCSTPMALLVLVLLLHVLHRADLGRPATAAQAGALAGLWALTRFDFLLGAAALGGVLVVRQTSPGRALRVAAAYGAALVLALSPWIVFSLARFGRPWVSDNARTVLLADSPHVFEYLPFPEIAPTLFTAPAEWAARKLPLVARFLASTCTSATRTGLPALLVLLLLLAFVARRRGCTPGARDVARTLAGEPALRAWACLAPSLILLHLAVGLTGYNIERYNAPLFLWLHLGAALAVLAAALRLQPASRASVRAGLAAALITIVLGFAHDRTVHPQLASLAVVVAALAGLLASRSRLAPIVGVSVLASTAALLGATLAFTGRPSRPSSERPWPEQDVRALRASDARVLTSVLRASRLAAEHGVRTYVHPYPSRPLTAFLFIERYGITHVTPGDPTIDAVVDEAFEHDELKLGHDTVRVLRGRRPGVRLVPLSREPGTVGPLSVRVEEVPPELAPGCRLVFNGSGVRVVRAVDGRTVRLDLPLPSQAAASPLVQDGPPFPALLLPRVRR